MTPNKQNVLIFLSDKMEATAEMIGIAISPDWWPLDSKRKRASVLLGQLKYLDLVMRLPELKAWRLTKKGREWVSQSNDRVTK